MSIHEICQQDVELINPEESVYVAAERMHQRTVGALVVVDAARCPVGILTDRDLVVRALAHGKDAYTTCVDEVMTRAPKTISIDGSVQSALSLMRRRISAFARG